ncbi:ThiF family adenylyltransferase [Burkholderia pseudomallei]|uniref:HesA/MoeB/ThiF family protein n=1 Tax=Burkholderia pseudomallei TaxID=28450 RepID=UPI00138E558F
MFPDFIVFSNEKPVGIVNPSILIGASAGGDTSVLGPLGASKIRNPQDKAEVCASIAAVGGLLLGSESEISEVSLLLRDTGWSRTVAHFCCEGANCSDVLRCRDVIINSEVKIVGCGGIGSLGAVLLAGAGFRRLCLIDADTVERTNLNRQLFWTLSDIGRPKVDVLAEVISARFASTHVETWLRRVDCGAVSALGQGADAILFCADEPLELLREFHDFAENNQNVVCVSAGYSFGRGLVTLIRRHLFPPINVDRNWRPLVGGIMPSYGPLNAEVAGKAVALLIFALGWRTYAPRGIDISWRFDHAADESATTP